MAFLAEDDDQARAIIDDQQGSMRSDLKVLVDTDGKPLWDGKSPIEAREATAAQTAAKPRVIDFVKSVATSLSPTARRYAGILFYAIGGWRASNGGVAFLQKDDDRIAICKLFDLV